MPDPFTLAAIITLLAKNAPSWLDALRGTLLDKGKEVALEKGKEYAVEKGTGFIRSRLHLDEKEQQRHLELALKNAVERGLARFSTPEERDQYRNVLAILSEPGAHSDTLRREALRLFTLSETPSLAELNEAYNRSLRTRSLAQPTPPVDVNAAPYLSSFFDALIAELYADPYFKQQIIDVLQVRAATSTQRTLTEVLTTLRQVGEAVAHNYTSEQLERDVAAYTAHIEMTSRYLKLVGVVPKDRGSENKDPALDGIFVPLSIGMQDPIIVEGWALGSVIDRLESFPCLVLLGGPGSGKSTATRHLAWSHARANLPDSSAYLSNSFLLTGKPLPLRIELRRLIEDRRHHLNYNFLSYATEVLLGREGVEINSQMFRELLERRTMLLLFDGLDEVATLDERLSLIKEIEGFALHYPGNRILVTSRPVGYELTRLSYQWFAHAQVQDFNDEQIRQFLERWYTYVLRLSPIPQDDRQELEALLTTLQENPRLHRLAENPLLLTVITALHRYERLPDRRVLVYDRCADLLLEIWAKLKGTNVRWKDMKMVKEDQYACIAHLGFVLHERSQERESKTAGSKEDIANDVPTRFMLREIEHFLNSRKLITEGAEQRAEAKRFLELMQVEVGLIVERGTNENGQSLYGFVHRTFQEYFAAADVYERYLQEEDPTIISEFLEEHLHDPHWSEVILLLLGKLKRKPVTAQLHQILEGKIKSRRSQYTDVVQQDLFFVCDCLIEEIIVENELAETIVLRLSNLVKNSSFPSQQDKALEDLGSMMQTRQYSNLARGVLIALISEDIGQDILTRIEAVRILYLNILNETEAQQQVKHMLSNFTQGSNLSFEQRVKVAQALYLINPEESGERRQALQQLLLLLQTPDLTLEQIVYAARTLTQTHVEALYLDPIPLPHPIINIKPEPALSFEQSIDIAQQQQDFHQLLILLQKPDLTLEQVVYAARTLTQAYERVQHQDLKQFPRDANYAQRHDSSFEQFAQVPQITYKHVTVELEWPQTIQISSTFATPPNLPFEHAVWIAELLYRSSLDGSEEQRQMIQMLLSLAQWSNAPIEQAIQAAQVLYEYSTIESEEWQQAARTLLNLVQRPDIPTIRLCMWFRLFTSPILLSRRSGG